MSATPTVAEIADDIQKLTALRGCFARPQKLSWVSNRLYWLEGMTQELYHVDVGVTEGEPLAPQRTIVVAQTDATKEPAVERKLTKEEELLRERQRTIVSGISWYSVRESDGVVLYISAMALFMYSPQHKKTLNVLDFMSSEAKVSCSSAPCINIQCVEGDVTLSHFTFVCDANVFSLDIVQSHFEEGRLELNVQRITTVGKALSEFGTADYIMQEEFDRYTGHVAKGDSILMLHTDTSMLRKVSIAAENGEIEELPFPRVGDPNALSSVAIYNKKSKTFSCIPNSALEKAFGNAFVTHPSPALEYITRFGFINDETIYLQLLDRKQENCAILSIAISALPCVDESSILRSATDFHNADSTLGTIFQEGVNVVWSQSIPFAWCEITNAIRLSSSPQLLGAHAADTGGQFFHIFQNSGINEWQQLTKGDWNVVARSVVFSTDRVFFESNIGDRLGNVFCSVPVHHGDGGVVSPTIISQPGECVHSFIVSNDRQHVAYVASTETDLATLWVVRLGEDGNPISSTIRRDIPLDWELKRNTALLASLVRPHIVTYTNPRGVPISGAVFLPKEENAAGGTALLPLMMYVYGGPHVQLVYSNAVEIACSPTIQAMLKRGIAVAIVDNQMSNANGLKDLSVCKKRMGQFEVEEYVAFKKQLCQDPQFSSIIDSSRIGVFGWSYGGYATLLCMSQAQQEFKLGYSGAPVGDWRLYDTGYTERYMGLLNDVDENGRNCYEDSRVARFADGFPDELDRLYIAHGLLDENVHFSHSCDVISALVERFKPYQMLVYPGERHGLRQKKTSRNHHDAQMIRTIMARL
ncbi:dipeptidyl-peptidase 8-like serine peptidase, putative [Bodo saltans]|uniref:Dipeptidyl-peptidase 8-like serine peptidase, putative n=1 Tax=Bodo saltans TaxID=75058 RepID=A0A0S4JPE0_BODSA|nr:dipeptidyl-peptidase 8-like serine peptidase, putative [Bodo saltans]|eukprot:CUG93388.1 dipeptidyl-peptidase 8-like serine peptidase, putative [Bodo saltans]